MLIKTNLFVPKKFDAYTVWPFIFIRPEYADNHGLIEHEMVHYREQRNCLLLPWLLRYMFSKKFRLAAEVRAYKRQVEVGGITIGSAAHHLTKYNIPLSYLEALAKLRT